MASKQGYMKFLKKKMAEGGRAEPGWGEIGGDPGYGQKYSRRNSSGEPHTNDLDQDEQDMEYMASGGKAQQSSPTIPPPPGETADITQGFAEGGSPVDPEKWKQFQQGYNESHAEGGMVGHYNEDLGEPHPDPDHDEQSMSVEPDMEWEDNYGEPDPENDHDDQEDPDLAPHPMARDQIHAQSQYAEGGKVSRYHTSEGEEQDNEQEDPDMSDSMAMSRQGPMPGYAGGGKAKLGSGARFEHLTHQLAGKGANDPKALAAYIGRKNLGKQRFQKLAAKGKMAGGGMAFAKALKKGMR